MTEPIVKRRDTLSLSLGVAWALPGHVKKKSFRSLPGSAFLCPQPHVHCPLDSPPPPTRTVRRRLREEQHCEDDCEMAPAHLYVCVPCQNLTFTHYRGAYQHILLDHRHQRDRDIIRLQVGLSGERESINAMISVYLIADGTTANQIRDSERGGTPLAPTAGMTGVDPYAHVCMTAVNFLLGIR